MLTQLELNVQSVMCWTFSLSDMLMLFFSVSVTFSVATDSSPNQSSPGDKLRNEWPLSFLSKVQLQQKKTGLNSALLHLNVEGFFCFVFVIHTLSHQCTVHRHLRQAG